MIASGASSRIFDLGDGRILKLFRESVSDEMIEREVEVTAFAHAQGLPVPRPLDRRITDGERGIVYPLLDGRTLLSALRTQWAKGQALLQDMAALHGGIHDQNAAGDFRSVRQVLDTDIHYGPASEEAKQAVIAHLDTLPDGEWLLHGDYHIGNIMLTADGMRVIDWAKGARGMPAADVVRTEMLIRFGIGPSDMLTNLWRDWAARFYVGRYLARTGMTEAELTAWRPVVATAWLRARLPVRDRAFRRYLNQSLRACNLPPAS
ncbi:aminoglycoside phosphotransferase family protein [Sphingobium aromaticiconvertens]|uniref:aminoglycoside phosphotransferase family protein n=1 Tax=Sphingobium aromaticiconvertens TaxID=365341 RepID=UPI00301B2350